MSLMDMTSSKKGSLGDLLKTLPTSKAPATKSPMDAFLEQRKESATQEQPPQEQPYPYQLAPRPGIAPPVAPTETLRFGATDVMAARQHLSDTQAAHQKAEPSLAAKRADATLSGVQALTKGWDDLKEGRVLEGALSLAGSAMMLNAGYQSAGTLAEPNLTYGMLSALPLVKRGMDEATGVSVADKIATQKGDKALQEGGNVIGSLAEMYYLGRAAPALTTGSLFLLPQIPDKIANVVDAVKRGENPITALSKETLTGAISYMTGNALSSIARLPIGRVAQSAAQGGLFAGSAVAEEMVQGEKAPDVGTVAKQGVFGALFGLIGGAHETIEPTPAEAAGDVITRLGEPRGEEVTKVPEPPSIEEQTLPSGRKVRPMVQYSQDGDFAQLNYNQTLNDLREELAQAQQDVATAKGGIRSGEEGASQKYAAAIERQNSLQVDIQKVAELHDNAAGKNVIDQARAKYGDQAAKPPIGEPSDAVTAAAPQGVVEEVETGIPLERGERTDEELGQVREAGVVAPEVEEPSPAPSERDRILAGTQEVAEANRRVVLSTEDLQTHPSFQNRDNPFSEESVNRIMDEGWDWNKYNTIKAWQSPEGDIYTLNHSRLEAAKRLGIKELPVELIDVPSFAEAEELARNSNNLVTAETPYERANLYRDMREKGLPESEISKRADTYEGKNKGTVIALSRLDPRSAAVENLKIGGDTDTSRDLLKYAEWTGKIQQAFPEFTRAHQNEVYNYLLENGSDFKGITAVKDFVQRAYDRSYLEGFDPNEPLNLAKAKDIHPSEVEFGKRVAEARKNYEDARNVFNQKKEDAIAQGFGEDHPVVAKAQDEVVSAERTYRDLLLQKSDVLARIRASSGNLFDAIDAHPEPEKLVPEQAIGKFINPRTGNLDEERLSSTLRSTDENSTGTAKILHDTRENIQNIIAPEEAPSSAEVPAAPAGVEGGEGRNLFREAKEKTIASEAKPEYPTIAAESPIEKPPEKTTPMSSAGTLNVGIIGQETAEKISDFMQSLGGSVKALAKSAVSTSPEFAEEHPVTPTPETPQGVSADDAVMKRFLDVKNQWLGEKSVQHFRADVVTDNIQRRIQETIPRGKSESKYDWNRRWHDVDEAIHIYLDTKRNPGHFDEYYDKLTPRQKRIADLSRNLTPEQYQIADEIEKAYQQTGQIVQDASIVQNVLDNYVNRNWQFAGKPFSEASRRFGTSTRHSMERTLDTILEGQASGLELSVKGASNNLGILLKEISNVIEDRRLIEEGSTLTVPDQTLFGEENVAGEGSPLFTTQQIEGYRRIENPSFKKWAFAGKIADYPEQEIQAFGKRKDIVVTPEGTVLQKQDIYAPEPVAKNLNNILGASKLKGIPLVDAITKFNARIKSIILTTSLFHPLAFMRNHLLTGQFRSLGEINPRAAKEAGKEMMRQFNPEIERLVRNGLTLGKIQDWEEPLLQQRSILGQKLDKLGIAPEFRDRLHTMHDASVHWLFNDLGAGLKAVAALSEYKEILRRHPDLDVNEAARVAGQLTNDNFGGINLQRIGRNPTTQHLFRLLTLAPDWTESNIRLMVNSFKGGVEGETYRRLLARTYLRGISAVMAGNLLFALSGDERDKNGNPLPYGQAVKQRFFESLQDPQRMRWLMVDISPLYHALGGAPEKKAYFSPMGHFIDPFKAVADPLKFINAKSSVVTKVGFQAMTGEDWRGRPFTSLDEMLGLGEKAPALTKLSRGYLPHGPVSWQQVPSFVIDQVRQMMPIQAQQMWEMFSGENSHVTSFANALGIGMYEAKVRPSNLTPFESAMHDIKAGQYVPQERTPEEEKLSKTKKDIVTNLRSGKPETADQLAQSVNMPDAEYKKLLTEASKNPLEELMQGISIRQVIQALPKANEDEKKIIIPHLTKSISTNKDLTQEQKQAYYKQLGVEAPAPAISETPAMKQAQEALMNKMFPGQPHYQQVRGLAGILQAQKQQKAQVKAQVQAKIDSIRRANPLLR